LAYELRILGPLEVVRDGQALRLGGRKPRTLVALLALEPGELGFLSGIAYSLEGLAAVHAARRDGRRAAEVLGAAHVVGERSGVHLEPFEQELHDRTVATARGLLGNAAFEAAFAAGTSEAPAATG